MPTYAVNAMVQRPIFLQLEVDADSPAAAEALAKKLLDVHVGLKHIEEFPELLGESEGMLDGVEILDVEDVSW